MSTEAIAEVLPNELAQIVRSIFMSMLDLESSECNSQWSPGEDRLSAAVHLAGDWNGALILECSPEQACRFTSRFLSIDVPESVNDMVRDVLGELANMIGGNLKCLLTPGIQLSMPVVVNGSDYAFRICGAEIQTRLPFQCEGEQFWVTILATRSEMQDRG